MKTVSSIAHVAKRRGTPPLPCQSPSATHALPRVRHTRLVGGPLAPQPSATGHKSPVGQRSPVGHRPLHGMPSQNIAIGLLPGALWFALIFQRWYVQRVRDVTEEAKLISTMRVGTATSSAPGKTSAQSASWQRHGETVHNRKRVRTNVFTLL